MIRNRSAEKQRHTTTSTATQDGAPLLLSRSLTSSLLRFYDYPHPTRPGHIIRGYDRQHALRTARMCAAIALRLGHAPGLVKQFQIACILHDLGRAGLDRKLFGQIWSWAREHGVPTRPREWRAKFRETAYGRETESFLNHYRKDLELAGIHMDAWAKEQVEMRLGFAQRFNRRLRVVKPELQSLGIHWTPWMTRVALYYYYPEKLANDAPWIRQFGETLVASEQFEAYNNRQRGRDYYCRNEETVHEALDYLETLRGDGIISAAVMNALVSLAAEGKFDRVIVQARGVPVTAKERTALKIFAAPRVRQ